jgi:hypothetical protein
LTVIIVKNDYKPLCLLSDNNRKWFFCGTFSSMKRGTPTGNNRKTFSASKSVLHANIDNDLREANWKCCTTLCILFSLFVLHFIPPFLYYTFSLFHFQFRFFSPEDA